MVAQARRRRSIEVYEAYHQAVAEALVEIRDAFDGGAALMIDVHAQKATDAEPGLLGTAAAVSADEFRRRV